MHERFFREVQQLFLTSFFFLVLLMTLRLIFILIYQSHWSFSGDEFVSILQYGFLMDLKSSRFPIGSFVLLVTLPAIFNLYRTNWLRHTRNFVILFWLFVITFLGFGRIIYYGYFKATFNHFLFQSTHEDPWVLLSTLHHDYPFWWLFPVFLIALFFFFKAWSLISEKFLYPLPIFRHSYQKGLFSFLLLLFTFGIYTQWATAEFTLRSKPCDWETIEVLPVSAFAREAILDDFEGLSRARTQYKAFSQASFEKLSYEQMHAYLSLIQDPNQIDNQSLTELEPFFKRKAAGRKIPKPSHIFIIVGESYSQWPLLPSYEQMHLADGVKKIVNQPNSLWLQNFLSNSTFTKAGLTPIVTGLTGIALSPNHERETYRAPYGTALAPQLSALGYQSHFWYGGPGSWEEIRPYTLAQGFFQFHGVGDPGMPSADKLTYWGVPDRDLFDGIITNLPKDIPTLNVILTTSNHSPFNVDIVAEGFPREQIRASLPLDKQDDDALINQLGHFWYADQQISRFIAMMKEQYPDSLFIILGDHPDRMTNRPVLSLFDSETIPFIIHGPGVTPDLIPSGTAGGQMHLVPTLIELIAPKGFVYYSLAPSLTTGTLEGFSSEFWITGKEIGSRREHRTEPVSYPVEVPKNARNAEWEDAVLDCSWWRIYNGNTLQTP